MSKHDAYAYRKIWEQHHGPIPKGKHIHHIDGDKTNNDISNLICISREMHREIHLLQYQETNNETDLWAYYRLGGNNVEWTDNMKVKRSKQYSGKGNPMHGKIHPNKGKKLPQCALSKESNVFTGNLTLHGHLVCDTWTGIFYDSRREAERCTNHSRRDKTRFV